MVNYIILNSNSISTFEGLMTLNTREMYRKNKSILAMGAIWDDTACGYMIFEHTDDGYIIQDIFVHPDYRRRGIGRGLLSSLIGIAYHMLEDIDCYFIERDDNALRLLFESMKVFVPEEVETTGTYEVSLEALSQSKFLKPFKGMSEIKNSCIDFYEEFLPMERKALLERNPKIGSTSVSVPMEKDEVTKYCFASMDENKDKFVAFIKVNDGGDYLYVESLWYEKGNEKSLVTLLSTTFQKALKEEKYQGVRTCVVDEDVLKFLKHIAPEIKKTGSGYSVWWNYELPGE